VVGILVFWCAMVVFDIFGGCKFGLNLFTFLHLNYFTLYEIFEKQ
jgi:hypothetical protein